MTDSEYRTSGLLEEATVKVAFQFQTDLFVLRRHWFTSLFLLLGSLGTVLLTSHFAEASEILRNLVSISSGSSDVEGVNKVQDLFESELKALGFSTERFIYPGNKLGSLVVGSLKGESPQFITFLVHADTVFEKGSGFDGFSVSADGKTASGPGVIDNKGGMVVLLNALKDYLGKTKKPKYSLRVISTPAEEVGMPAFLERFQSYSKDSKLVLGFEPCLEDGALIDSRRGNTWYEIKVKGREAHAGRAHKDGINACWELARKLDALSKLTNYKKDLTVSIGHIEGGKDKFNVVCGEATAKVDVRFSTLEMRDFAHKQVNKIVSQSTVKSESDSKGTTASFEIRDETSPFPASAEAKPYLASLKTLIQKYENRDVISKQSGGAADVNVFSRKGLPIIDGLGACGGKMHTSDEFIELSTLETRAKVISEFLNWIN